jgi:AbrB family looped-hinge helix DNA binding protein
MTTILKTTSKGQITIPASWRKKFNTNQFTAVMKEDKLEIKPLILEKEKEEVKEFTVFDAIRDNKGKGIKAKDLVNILKKTV